MIWQSEFSKLLERIHAADRAGRGALAGATQDFHGRRLKRNDVLRALSLASSMEEEAGSFEDPAANLLWAINDSLSSKDIPLLRDTYPQLSRHARLRVLARLAELGDEASLKAFLSFLRFDSRRSELEDFPVHEFEGNLLAAATLFPAVFDFLDSPKLQHGAFLLALRLLEKGGLTPERLEDRASRILDIADALLEKVRPLQQSEGSSWMWQEPYRGSRSFLGVTLDLLGLLGAESARGIFERGLSLHDPKLKLFCVTALLRLGTSPPENDLFLVASAPETRLWMHRKLSALNRLDLFPERFSIQEAFAESEMVEWLIFPTELDSAPDEIELAGVVSRQQTADCLDHYVFRFRVSEPHWAAKDGWMAGLAGPYRRSPRPSPEGLGATFSKFKKWDEMTIEDHVSDLLEVKTYRFR
jgi:hypothetical protein